MALRVTQSKNARRAQRYFKDSLVREDYLTEGREITGEWGGLGAARLGLTGAVDAATFCALTENTNPQTGNRLTQRTREGRRVGYDFTFSAPKSVSLHQALLEQPEVLAAFERSIAETMAEMEADMHTRVRRNGAFSERKTGNMIWAGFTHFTARPVDDKGADPHLHKHVFVFNATWDDAEARWKAGEFGHLHLKRPCWEARFHSRLAENLRAAGYRIARTQQNFEIEGYERATVDRYSRRTREIEREARARGIVNPTEKGALGARTRSAKDRGTSVKDLRDRWWRRLSDDERRRVHRIEGSRGEGERSGGGDEAAGAALSYAVAECFERRSVAKRHEFLTAMLKAGISNLSVTEAEAAVRAGVASRTLILADWEGETCVTTPEVQAEERRMLAYARETQGACPPFVPGNAPLPAARDGRPRPPDWEEAAQRILGSRDRVTMLMGRPGAGKTSVMQTVSDVLERDGVALFAFAPSSMASRENQVRAGFGNAETLATLYSSEALQEQLRGQVIWVDEAGMVGARDTCRLFALAERLDVRIILTGDPNQHKPVDRGDAMRVLELFGQTEPVRLNVIRRQTERAYREAATEISEGRIATGFERLVEMGAIHEIDDWEDRTARIAEDYARLRCDRGKSVLVVSPTHHERQAVAASIRGNLQERGVVDTRDERLFVHWQNRALQRSQKADPIYYEVGDRVRFHRASPGFTAGSSATVVGCEQDAVHVVQGDGDGQLLPLAHADRFDVFEEGSIRLAPGDEIRITRNGLAMSTDPSGRKHRLSNGRTYRLEGFTQSGDLVLDNGFIVSQRYATLDYGYAVTSYAAQSLDEDVVLVAQGHASFRASCMEQFLVSVTRGKDAIHIYTDDRDGLRDAVQRSAARVSATELLGANEDESVPQKESRVASKVEDWVTSLSRQDRADQGREVEVVHKPTEPDRGFGRSVRA